MYTAAILLVGISLFGKVGAALTSVPNPVLGEQIYRGTPCKSNSTIQLTSTAGQFIFRPRTMSSRLFKVSVKSTEATNLNIVGKWLTPY